MKLDDIISNEYIHNASDIISLYNANQFKLLLNKITYKKINVNSHLIHKNDITMLEQFIFNIDNYISFIKNKLLINQLEIRYILDLTLYNKENKILFSNIYFYDDVNLYINSFKKMFMYNFFKNYNILKKYINIKKYNFDELIEKMNRTKNKAHYYLENISKNLPYYIEILDYLENTSSI